MILAIDLSRLRRAQRLAHAELLPGDMIGAVEPRQQDPLDRDTLTVLLSTAGIDKVIESLSTRFDQVGVVLVDIDQFKDVNDTSGMDAGHMVLIEAARRLERVAGVGEALGRIGGDEFILLIPGTTREHARARALAMIHAFDAPFEVLDRDRPPPRRWPDAHFELTASVEVSLVGAPTDRFTALREADWALYQAKIAGGAMVREFDSDWESN